MVHLTAGVHKTRHT